MQRRDFLAGMAGLFGAALQVSFASAVEPVRMQSLRTIKLVASADLEPAVVVSLALSPGGKFLAAAGDDHHVWIWDPHLGQLKHRLPGHNDWVRAVTFSPDGLQLISSGNDRQVRMWEAESGKLLHKLPLHQQAIAGTAYAPNGQQFATIGFENTLKLYNAQDGKLLQELACSSADNRAVEYSPDGSLLAVCGRDGEVRIWQSADWTVRHNLAADRRRVRAVQFSPDGTRLASAGEGRMIRLWDTTTGEMISELPCPSAKLFSLAFLSNHLLACGGTDNRVMIWDLDTSTISHVLEGHTGSVASLSYDRASGLLASGSYDTTILLWDVSALGNDRSTRAPLSGSLK